MKGMLLLVFMIACVSSEPWQAAGNFTDGNISDIRSILSSKESLLSSTLTLQTLAKAISDELNTKWHPAWNVFVSVPTNISDPKDMVQYGYGFNNHWLWYNGFGVKNYSYAIWKDYNCYNWVDVYINNPQSASFIGEAETNTITSNLKNLPAAANGVLQSYAKEIWQLTSTISSFVFSGNGQKGAWSSVIAEDSATFTGRFCNFYIGGFNNYGAGPFVKGVGVTKNWNYLIFKTRD